MPPSIQDQFSATFGRPCAILVNAPGRINLIGEHVDYQGGLVMPAAIDRYISAAAARIDQRELRIHSSVDRRTIRVPLEPASPLTGDRSWANYVVGVAAKYREAGHQLGGLELALSTSLPIGAGLSSSAALESATALVIESLFDLDLPPRERALLCQRAEHDWAGVPCGIMDQLAVNCGVAGHALKIDCQSLQIETAPLPQGFAIVVVDSKVKHALADGEYAKRKADCEAAADALGVANLREADAAMIDSAQAELGDRIYRRARHVVDEIGRVREFTRALEGGDTAMVGALMAASHASLRDNYEVSCPELDTLVDLARGLGAAGARLMGGGFGGSTVNLVPAEHASEFARKIVDRYQEARGAEVEAFIVQAVDGASREEPA